jgi:hypothetical protein
MIAAWRFAWARASLSAAGSSRLTKCSGTCAGGSSFGKGALLAANLGDDADTTAAIFGQLAGAFYSASAIPEKWLAKLAQRDMITGLADQLLALSESLPAAASK